MCHYLQVVSSEKLETRKGQVVIGMKEQERKKKWMKRRVNGSMN